MASIKVGTENGCDIGLHDNDHGVGKAMILVHGHPLDGTSWERQAQGCWQRGIAASAATGADSDTRAGRQGDMTTTRSRPRDIFEGLKQAAVADRYAFCDSFLGNLNNTDVTIPDRLTDSALRASSQVAYGSGPYATRACIDTWLTDFRPDLPMIDIPVLAVHGTADRALPFDVTTARLRDERLIADLTVVEIAAGPHNVGWTHADQVNSALLSFLRSEARDSHGAIAAAGQM
jgi:non-heme chloroperoxidase